MKNTKRNLFIRLFGGIVGTVIGLTSVGAGAEEIKSINNGQVSGGLAAPQTEKKSKQYYSTKTGKRYHKEGCVCLKKSKIKVTKKGIKEADLKPCKKCCK